MTKTDLLGPVILVAVLKNFHVEHLERLHAVSIVVTLRLLLSCLFSLGRRSVAGQGHPAEPPQKSWILKFFNIISAIVLLVRWYMSTSKWANQFAHAEISPTLYESDIIYSNIF